jgi:hypothetical protein
VEIFSYLTLQEVVQYCFLMTSISFSYAITDLGVSNPNGSFQRDLIVRPSYRGVWPGVWSLLLTISKFAFVEAFTLIIRDEQ